MPYSVQMHHAGPDGRPSSDYAHFTAPTEAGAIEIAIWQLRNTSYVHHPMTFRIFDPTRRMIIAYTSERPIS